MNSYILTAQTPESVIGGKKEWVTVRVIADNDEEALQMAASSRLRAGLNWQIKSVSPDKKFEQRDPRPFLLRNYAKKQSRNDSESAAEL